MGKEAARKFEDLIVWQKAHQFVLDVYFYNTSQGPIEECRYYLILARDLGYGQIVELSNQLEETSKLLHSYMSAVIASTY